ncbi:MAG TPA: hypothetical protein VK191_05835 [Symbiobacteriaceae bacterium]|nr:hypothetical protein [Symbiobacteriaceae bacterium]
MTSLLDAVLGESFPQRLAVIGLSKNAGKTVALNHVIRAAAERGIPLGLVSTGRDGEVEDAITELPKPRIWAPAGAVLATAKGALSACEAKLEVLTELPLTTPFGRVVLCRVVAEGQVLLIGPGSRSRVATVLAHLEAEGAQLSLVDGSFDRIAAAAPDVTGRVVLAAGAAYSVQESETLSQVRHVLESFDLPVWRGPEAVSGSSGSGVGAQGGAGTSSSAGPSGGLTAPAIRLERPDGSTEPLPVVSTLAHPDAFLHLVAPGDRLHLNGPLADLLLNALIHRRLWDLDLIVQDPTHLLVSRLPWRRWRSNGGRAWVRRPVQLLAVTTNAYSPVGPAYDPVAFHAAVAHLAGRPVYDLEVGLTT